MIINLKDVSVSLGERRVLKNVEFTLESEKRFYGIIGPNGSGKSTFLRLIYRALRPHTGCLIIDGATLERVKARELARRIAVVPQNHCGTDLSVQEMLEMGRYPYKGLFEGLKRRERELVAKVTEELDLTQLKDRPVNTLSGGERQLALLGRAMVQETEAILLDEPTNHLDIRHQVMILDLLAKMEKLIVVVFHDLNLASKYCEEIILFADGAVHSAGSPKDIITQENIQSVYGQKVDIMPHPKTSRPVVLI